MDRTSIQTIIEVEKGSTQRAVFDDTFKVLGYRQVSATYPFAYGFILNTSSEDGDEIDCYILTDKHLELGKIIDCIPIGLLEVFENEEVDNKLICIIESDDFKFNQIHLKQIKDFIQQIFKKYSDIKIQFGEYKDQNYAASYVNDRLTN